MIRYHAHVVYTGSGDDLIKLGVYPYRPEAKARAEREGARVTTLQVATQRELEDIVEDDLTDRQAEEYRVGQVLIGRTVKGDGMSYLRSGGSLEWIRNGYDAEQMDAAAAKAIVRALRAIPHDPATSYWLTDGP